MVEHIFTFGAIASKVRIQEEIPPIETLLENPRGALIVCDENTLHIAQKISGESRTPLCILKSGEEHKSWAGVETILRAAMDAELGRDGLFIGVGGGVVGDMTAFASNVYMRGSDLVLTPTSLLAMVDASVGGKTGFDLFGVKNLVGTFRPAPLVVIPAAALKTLPPKELKSGAAELLKTAILDENDSLFKKIEDNTENIASGRGLVELIARSIEIKARIVEEDPLETGSKRALLNLGHTFGHALEAAAGLGALSHGEAVAWGIARACALGLHLRLTPPARAKRIIDLLLNLGYETSASHPLLRRKDAFMRSLLHDKKKRTGRLSFVVPVERSAALVPLDDLTLVEGLVDAAL
jgi:3-dehydroquinate synthase